RPPRSCATPVFADLSFVGSPDDDLRPRRLAAAGRLVAERTALFSRFQPDPDRLLRDFRADLSHPAAGSLGPRDHLDLHEARGAAPPGGGGGDPPARRAARLPALSSTPGKKLRLAL